MDKDLRNRKEAMYSATEIIRDTKMHDPEEDTDEEKEGSQVKEHESYHEGDNSDEDGDEIAEVTKACIESGLPVECMQQLADEASETQAAEVSSR